jgi:hypothetical protein
MGIGRKRSKGGKKEEQASELENKIFLSLSLVHL